MLTCSESDVACAMNHHQKVWADHVFEIEFENGDSETDDVGWWSKMFEMSKLFRRGKRS